MRESQYRIIKTCSDVIGMEIEDGVLNNIPEPILLQFNAMFYEMYSAVFREVKYRISKQAFASLEQQKQAELLMQKRFANIGLEI